MSLQRRLERLSITLRGLKLTLLPASLGTLPALRSLALHFDPQASMLCLPLQGSLHMMTALPVSRNAVGDRPTLIESDVYHARLCACTAIPLQAPTLALPSAASYAPGLPRSLRSLEIWHPPLRPEAMLMLPAKLKLLNSFSLAW